MSKIDLKKLRKSVNMSQNDLAERLGISRATLTKIESGERNLTISEREKVMQIFSGISDFEKQNSNPDMRISIPQKKLEKFKQVLLYILEKVGSKPNVGMTFVYKLLYFIDFDYYEKYEEQLMGLTYIKNHHGPTPKEFIKVVEDMKLKEEIEEVQSKFWKYEQKKFMPRIKPKLSLISGQEIELIDSVLSKLSDKTATELSEYSHKDIPWLTHEEGEEINYESVFYRTPEYSVRNYAN